MAALAACRWPQVGSPHVGTRAVVRHVARRPRVARLLRADPDPQRSAGVAMVAAAATLVLGAIGVGVLLLMIRSGTGLAGFDLRFAEFAARHASSSTTSVLRRVSLLGGTSGIIAVALVAALAEYWRSRSRAVFTFLVTVVAGQFLIANLVKWVVDRARPTIDQLTGFAGTSFPSGHATAAAATFAAIALLVGRNRSTTTRAVLTGAGVAVAVAVASTRVLLGVHWFTDVIGGLLIGWTWFAICSIAFGGRWLHFGAPLETAERAAEQAPTPASYAGVEEHDGATTDARGLERHIGS